MHAEAKNERGLIWRRKILHEQCLGISCPHKTQLFKAHLYGFNASLLLIDDHTSPLRWYVSYSHFSPLHLFFHLLLPTTPYATHLTTRPIELVQSPIPVPSSSIFTRHLSFSCYTSLLIIVPCMYITMYSLNIHSSHYSRV